ncbi:DUF72 domain-containing protein [Flavobacterium sp.]|uniref:DUF72 domain-containing protein n=1 Tax=Flavobacterium sp. TaxID=239 RepID=UPI002CAC3979|nr:DUF72 domain-containing protein [Flavobacterium sp.]HSD09008.1 DUF72 domain-containing protein [Flavobacterium sp.]
MKKHSIHIGTSGWLYKHWRGTFYPKEVKIKDQFSYYVSMFNTVEINNTFYGVPSDETFVNWKNTVPQDFVYVIKANRFITHMKKLHDPNEILHPFLSKVELLKTKLGAVLFQLPPSLGIDLKVLEDFLAELPKDKRFVFEFRNTSWYTPEVYHLLSKYNVAFCIYELAEHLSPIQITANFIYLRLHGPGKNKYQGSYSDEKLMEWAQQCKIWLQENDVYVYFDNDEQGYAAFNALKLKELVQNMNIL